MWMIKVIILCLFLQNGWAENSKLKQHVNDLNDKHLMNCIVNLAQIISINEPTILILEDKKDDNDDTVVNKMIERFMESNLPTAVQDTIKYHINQSLDVFSHIVIVIVNFKEWKALTAFQIRNVDKKVKYLIIIPEYTNDSFVILQKFGRKHIHYDISFVIRDPSGKNHRIETFIPVMNEKLCKMAHNVKPKQINVCSTGSLRTKAVFRVPQKVNLKKCPFKVGMANMFPFSKIPNKDELDNFDQIKHIEGSDVEIMKIITNYFNGTPQWHYIRREEQNPFINLDFVNLIVNGSLHAAAGGLYHIYGDRVSYSGIYTRQAAMWIYAIHRKCRSWHHLVDKLDGIYVFFIFHISYSGLSYLFRTYDYERPRAKDILFYSCGALLGLASLQHPRSLKHQILDISYLTLSIYLASYMNIQLYSFLTIDGPSTIFKTNDEVIKSGRIAYLNPKTKRFIQEQKYLEFADKAQNCSNFRDCHFKTLKQNGLTVTLDQFFYSLQAATAVNDEARVVRATQNIVTVYQEMLIIKDSAFVVGIQKIINRLFEAGICKQLFKEAVGLTVIGKAEIANKNAVSNSYSCKSGCAIALSQVAGVFYVWIIGTLLSICVFVVEILRKKPIVCKDE